MLRIRIPILVLMTAAAAAAANAPQVLHSFGLNLQGGSSLYAGLVLDAEGNLYGAAESGGTYNDGVVYRLSPHPGGSWTETVLYSFKGSHDQDGANPHATLAWDSAGNLYGTTVSGGLAGAGCPSGCGTVYQLSPSPNGWQESVVYRFMGAADGSVPYAGVSVDSAGDLYGATVAGGSANRGVIYKLTPGSSGWTQGVLHTFGGSDGSAPYAAPVPDAAGNLYGTTETGGAHNIGVVYALRPQASGAWTFEVLHQFRGGADGANPMAGVIPVPRGSLFGTTTLGGSANCGTAFELAPNASGVWSETILHTFLGVTYQDGENPNGLIFDPHGNLYGTSVGGGTDNPGTIFKLSFVPGSGWQETVLYSFTAGDDGAYPSSALVMDAAGNLFGTTLWGGPAGDTTGGVAFQYAP